MIEHAAPNDRTPPLPVKLSEQLLIDFHIGNQIPGIDLIMSQSYFRWLVSEVQGLEHKHNE